MKLAITGHRPARIRGHKREIENWIQNQVSELSPNICISGMAQGVDQMFANCAINNNIKLWCAYAFRGQESRYTEKYDYYADKVIYTSEDYGNHCYFVRDRYMVDNCDCLLAVWDGIETGGTWYTINYAKKKGIPIIYYMIGDNNE